MTVCKQDQNEIVAFSKPNQPPILSVDYSAFSPRISRRNMAICAFLPMQQPSTMSWIPIRSGRIRVSEGNDQADGVSGVVENYVSGSWGTGKLTEWFGCGGWI